MRVSGVSSLSSKLEVDADVPADQVEALLDHLRAFGPEFLIEHLLLVDAFLRCVWVQVEREPFYRKAVVGRGMIRSVCSDTLFQLLLANIAPAFV